MPKLVSLKVTADLAFYKDEPPVEIPPPGRSYGNADLSLSLAKPGGAAFDLPHKSSVTLIKVNWQFPTPEVTVDFPDTDKTEGFYLLRCSQPGNSKLWVNGVYVYGVKVRLTDNGISYVGQTLARLVVG